MFYFNFEHVYQGDRKAAVKLLEESEFKYRAGVVGALCTLLSADGEYTKASQLFHDVYQHYKNDNEVSNCSISKIIVNLFFCENRWN